MPTANPQRIDIQSLQQRFGDETALQDLDRNALIQHAYFDSTLGVMMPTVGEDPGFFRYRRLHDIVDQAQQMFSSRQRRIAQHPDVHLVRLRTMPAIATVAPERNPRCGQQDGFPRLAQCRHSLQRGRNLAGGLRAQQRELIHPAGVRTAEPDFCGIVTEQTVVIFGRDNPRTGQLLRHGPALRRQPPEDLVDQQSHGVVGATFFGQIDLGQGLVDGGIRQEFLGCLH